MSISPYVWPGVKVARSDIPKIIFDEVCAHYNVTIEQVLQRTKKRPYVFARQQIAYLLYKCIPYITLKKVGKLIGGYDWTTVLNSIQATKDAIDTEPETKELIERILKQLK